MLVVSLKMQGWVSSAWTSRAEVQLAGSRNLLPREARLVAGGGHWGGRL